MTHVWFWFGHLFQWTFKNLLVPMGWAPVYIFMIVLAFGALYWMNLQSKYTKRAKDRNEYI